MYDPSTGSWYEYSPGATTPSNTPYSGLGANLFEGVGGGVTNPASLNKVARPGNVGSEETPNYVDPSGDPHNIASNLINAQFAEWEKTFKPIELEQIQQYSPINPSVLTTAVDKAENTATQASASMGGILQRQNEKMGVNATSDQKNAMGRMLNLSTAENIANAKNTARSDVREQDQQILMGTSTNLTKE